MKQWVKAVWPGRQMRGRLLVGLGMCGVAVLAFCWGRQGALSEAQANPPTDANLPYVPTATTDYGKRVVAFVYESIPITREDLGEYLIERFGPQRVETLVNRRIIEMECRARGVFVTDAEVEAEFRRGLNSFNPPLTERDFVRNILSRYNKTLFEWKEDVIRPKLALTKLCRDGVQVSEQDLRNAFEAKYGEMVKCRMIVIQENDPRKNKIWTDIKQNPAAFDKYAREQFISTLAQQGGAVPPIHKHFGDPNIEREAFKLKKGETSIWIQLSDKSEILLQCDGRVPPNNTVRFEEVRMALQREVYDNKLNQEIPKYFAQLRERAHPRLLLVDPHAPIREENMLRDAKRDLHPQPDQQPRQLIPVGK